MDERKKIGRPKATPLERARREALKAKRLLDKADSEFRELLQPDPNDPPGQHEARLANANQRMRLAERLNDAQKAVAEARADLANGVPGAGARLRAARTEERRHWMAFRALPPLGGAEGEAPLRRRGRPQLDVEIKRVRAREALDAALAEVRRQERAAGEKHIPLDQLPALRSVSNGRGPGRPKLDRLGLLDRQLSRLEKQIAAVRRAARQTDADAASRAPQRGVGRAASPEARLRELREMALVVRERIAAAEARLDAPGRIRRELKKLRDERRRMTVAIRDDPGGSLSEQQRKAQLTAQIDALVERLEDIERAPAGAEPADDTDAAPAPAVASPPPAPSDRVALARRRAQVQAQVAAIEARYAELVAKLYQDFPEPVANRLVEAVEQQRKQERSRVDGIELIEEPI